MLVVVFGSEESENFVEKPSERLANERRRTWNAHVDSTHPIHNLPNHKLSTLIRFCGRKGGQAAAAQALLGGPQKHSLYHRHNFHHCCVHVPVDLYCTHTRPSLAAGLEETSPQRGAGRPAAGHAVKSHRPPLFGPLQAIGTNFRLPHNACTASSAASENTCTGDWWS